MSGLTSTLGQSVPADKTSAKPKRPGHTMMEQIGSVVPTWGLIEAKYVELRRRRGLMIAVVLLTLGLPVIVLGLRLLFHAVDPASYGPAGSPSIFAGLCNPMTEFGFIIAAALGASAGTTDLTDGFFRHLVATGRSRLALYLARIPAGLAILLPLVALAFTMLCLVTNFEGIPQPTTVGVSISNPTNFTVSTISIPPRLDETQLAHWLVEHRGQIALQSGPGSRPSQVRSMVQHDIATIYADYTADETTQGNPAMNEMVKIGLWVELEVAIGFLVGLGLGSLTGQRTVSTIVLIALEIIVTPILAAHVIPYFLDGQRLVVGIAMDQLRPAGLASVAGGGQGPGRVLFGGRGALAIPPMPTWAMISVIVGWIVGWSVIGAWRMVRRDV